jgi:hypothetical protein
MAVLCGWIPLVGYLSWDHWLAQRRLLALAIPCRHRTAFLWAEATDWGFYTVFCVLLAMACYE